MKLSIVLLLIFFCSLHLLYAQKKEKRIELGVSAGPNCSKESISSTGYISSTGNDFGQQKAKTGYCLGLVSKYKISDKFFLTAHIAYSNTRTGSTDDSYFVDDLTGASQAMLKINNSYTWISSPIIANYQISIHKNYNLFFGLGASPYWLLNAKSKLVFETSSQRVENTLDVKSRLKEVNLFGDARTGIGFNLSEGGKILFILEYQRSLFSLQKKEEQTSTGVFSYGASYRTTNLNIFSLKTCYVY